MRLRTRTIMAGLATFALGLVTYLQWVERRVGPVLFGLKNFTTVDIRVVDGETGSPVAGAEVRQVLFTAGPPPRVQDGPVDDAPTPPPLVTGADGRVVARWPSAPHRFRRRLLGLWPYAGGPEFAFHPAAGVSIRADGFRPWSRRLEVIRRGTGVRLSRGASLGVVVRLAREGREAGPDRGRAGR